MTTTRDPLTPALDIVPGLSATQSCCTLASHWACASYRQSWTSRGCRTDLAYRFRICDRSGPIAPSIVARTLHAVDGPICAPRHIAGLAPRVRPGLLLFAEHCLASGAGTRRAPSS